MLRADLRIPSALLQLGSSMHSKLKYFRHDIIHPVRIFNITAKDGIGTKHEFLDLKSLSKFFENASASEDFSCRVMYALRIMIPGSTQSNFSQIDMPDPLLQGIGDYKSHVGPYCGEALK